MIPFAGNLDPMLLAGLALVFVAVVLLGLAFTGLQSANAQRVARSLRAVQTAQASPRAAREQDLERPFRERVVQPLLERFTGLGRAFTPLSRVQHIKARLDLAGNPAGWDADRILGLKALGAIVLTLGGGVLGPALTSNPLYIAAWVVIGGAVGWFGPTMWIYQVGYDRSESMQRTLPDAIDLLTISVESGLAFDAALAQVARNTDGPLAAEFYRVLQEMQIGTGRLDAMRAMADRTNVAELRTLTGAMIQADAFGIPIANVLRIQSKELRVKRSQRAEAKAQEVPVKILFPLIFCILPTLFIVILGPVAMTLMTSGLGGR